MDTTLTDDNFGTLTQTQPATLTLQRLLPGPIDRIWAYLTDGDLRRLWLAAGAMELQAGAKVDFVWRNDELTDPPGQRPDGFDEEHRMTCEILACDPPHRLNISWGSTGGVTFALEEQGEDVMFTITHHRIEDRNTLLNISSGWHAHVDVLEATLRQTSAAPHWDNWVALRHQYDQRLPA